MKNMNKQSPPSKQNPTPTSKKSPPEVDLAQLQEKIKALEKEKEEYLNGWKKQRAEFINYKKDEEKRFAEVVNFANQKLIQELIPVLDSFDLAEQSFLAKGSKDKEDNYLKGMELIREQLEAFLEKMGVKIIGKVGDKFDPSFYEAVKQIPGKPAGIIKEVIGRGYILNGKVIRPARAIVSSI